MHSTAVFACLLASAFAANVDPSAECGEGIVLPLVLKLKQRQEYITCVNGQFVAQHGFEIIRSKKTGKIQDVRAAKCPECRTEYNYECVDKTCRCKDTYTERLVGGVAQCIQRECGIGERLPAVLKDKLERVSCINDRFVAAPGYELVRDGQTDEIQDVRVADTREMSLLAWLGMSDAE